MQNQKKGGSGDRNNFIAERSSKLPTNEDKIRGDISRRNKEEGGGVMGIQSMGDKEGDEGMVLEGLGGCKIFDEGYNWQDQGYRE